MRIFFFAFMALQSFTLLAVRLEWAHERIQGFGTPSQELPLDPKVQYSCLANGFRYAWAQNYTVKNHCSLRLLIHAGSLREEEGEQGIAHFLEHLVFNNTKLFPNRSLRSWFEQNGMKFGADINAETNFDYTEYKIELPFCTPKRMKEALIVFRDYADGVQILASDVEKEKGIIDAEEADRDTQSFRLVKKKWATLYAGITPHLTHLPIGVQEVRRNFTKGKIESFYKKWYRPDLMTLLIVGDFGDLDVTGLIQTTFISLVKPPCEVPAEANQGHFEVARKEGELAEARIPIYSVDFAKIEPFVKIPFTRATRLEEGRFLLAAALYENAVNHFSRETHTKFSSLSLGTFVTLLSRDTTMCINLYPKTWKEGLEEVFALHQQILTCGIPPSIFEDGKKMYAQSIKTHVEEESIASVLKDLHEDAIGLAPRLDPVFFQVAAGEILEQLTATEIGAYIQHFFSFEALKKASMLVYKNTEMTADGEIISFTKAQLDHPGKLKHPICAKNAPLIFQYPSKKPKKPPIYRTENHEGLSYKTTYFPNGIVAHTKALKDPSIPGKLYWKAKLGYGAWQFAVDLNFSSLFMNWLLRGGTKKHPFCEVISLLSDSKSNLDLLQSTDEIGFTGLTTQRESLQIFEWTKAYLTDPGWATHAFETLREEEIRNQDDIEEKESGMIYTEFVPLLYGRDLRFSSRLKKELRELDPIKLQTWLKGNLLTKCPEFVLVGEFETSALLQNLDQVFRNFQCVAQAKSDEMVAIRPQLRPGIHKQYQIKNVNPQAFIEWFIPFQLEKTQINAIGMIIEALLNNRLLVLLRTDHELTYTPSFSIVSCPPWFLDYFHIFISTDPANVANIESFLPQIFADSPITQTELEAARQPIISAMEKGAQEAYTWFSILPPMRPAPHPSFEDRILAIKALTPDEVREKLRTMLPPLTRDTYSSIVVLPRKK